MTPKLEEKLLELADKMGVTVEHLWGVLVVQAKISAVTDLIGALLWTLITVVGTVVSVKWYRKLRKETEDKLTDYTDWERHDHFPLWVTFCVFTVVVMLVSVINWCCITSPVITKLLNPEYWALQQLGDLLK
jgi:uncharacterized membrane protein YcaP (DUF421 family)